MMQNGTSPAREATPRFVARARLCHTTLYRQESSIMTTRNVDTEATLTFLADIQVGDTISAWGRDPKVVTAITVEPSVTTPDEWCYTFHFGPRNGMTTYTFHNGGQVYLHRCNDADETDETDTPYLDWLADVTGITEDDSDVSMMVALLNRRVARTHQRVSWSDNGRGHDILTGQRYGRQVARIGTGYEVTTTGRHRAL